MWRGNAANKKFLLQAWGGAPQGGLGDSDHPTLGLCRLLQKPTAQQEELATQESPPLSACLEGGGHAGDKHVSLCRPRARPQSAQNGQRVLRGEADQSCGLREQPREAPGGRGQGLGGCSTHSRSPRDLQTEDRSWRNQGGEEKKLNGKGKMLKEQKRRGSRSRHSNGGYKKNEGKSKQERSKDYRDQKENQTQKRTQVRYQWGLKGRNLKPCNRGKI